MKQLVCGFRCLAVHWPNLEAVIGWERLTIESPGAILGLSKGGGELPQ